MYGGLTKVNVHMCIGFDIGVLAYLKVTITMRSKRVGPRQDAKTPLGVRPCGVPGVGELSMRDLNGECIGNVAIRGLVRCLNFTNIFSGA
jgi:hypothetical protein